MSEFPFGYEKIEGATWAYLSSLLMIALFFKFNRFWSVRNLDLLLIILLVPGLLMVEGGRKWLTVHAPELVETVDSESSKNVIDPVEILNESERQANGSEFQAPAARNDSMPIAVAVPKVKVPAKQDTVGHRWQRMGYVWLFVVGLLILIRLIIDPSLTRRPLLEPNLSKGGLFFFGASLMVILGINVVLSEPTSVDINVGKKSLKMMKGEAVSSNDLQQLTRQGPGYPLFFLFPVLSTFDNGDQILETDAEEVGNQQRFVVAAKTVAIVSQTLIVLGLILFCYFNYNNLAVGVGTASIYLMLPYTAMYTGHVLHTLPAALIIWSLVCFRRPWLSGVLIGLATGVAYYPVFLLPLWASFYWERGVRRFAGGLAIAIGICILGLAFTPVEGASFGFQLRQMFGFWQPRMDGLEGIWALGWSSWWRLPILVAFVAYCVSFVAWPLEKNLGTLVSYTASIMVAVQFWHGGSGDGVGGGLYMAWYAPLLLLIVFRPNLTGRVASAELRETVRIKPESPEDLLPAA